MDTLREILTKKALSEGWSTNDEGLEEILRDYYTQVSRKEFCKHRWMIRYLVVVEIEDRFFQFTDFVSLSSDGDAESAGYEFEGIDKVPEVYPSKKVITVYKTTPPEGES